jgi:DnaJ-class molecular chaperone|tara:strand:- start:222 stop:431 length:210 start_codon:yes stop_codon:yes gene_type:complete
MAVVKRYILCKECEGTGTRNKAQALPNNVREIRKDVMLCPKCNGTGHSGYELLNVVREDDTTDSWTKNY